MQFEQIHAAVTLVKCLYSHMSYKVEGKPLTYYVLILGLYIDIYCSIYTVNILKSY